jgi:hypothetical protein
MPVWLRSVGTGKNYTSLCGKLRLSARHHADGLAQGAARQHNGKVGPTAPMMKILVLRQRHIHGGGVRTQTAHASAAQ